MTKQHACSACDAKKLTAGQLIERLESKGYGWDINHTISNGFKECRIWIWPEVVGRFTPKAIVPLADMLAGAMEDAGIDVK